MKRFEQFMCALLAVLALANPAAAQGTPGSAAANTNQVDILFKRVAGRRASADVMLSR
jgi:hypothetical protein